MAPRDGEPPSDEQVTLDERAPRSSDARLAGIDDYALGDVIGVGGMGEVVEARDHRIGRAVALKRMRDAEPSIEKVERFLREAKIQARLDHPAIVPVHELGFDAKGRPYFTMKRLAGITLAAVLDDHPTQQRLLRALVDVCNAIDFAHARGIVHRDLKPSNIMLGDYGEVYVIDWGVARVLGTRDTAPAIVEIDASDGTVTGQMLGTPGYMAPEQIESREVEAPADVYALGAILFEILAGERLHPGGAAALLHTTELIDGSPARRARDREIAPELDALCVAALDRDPARRPTAREVAERVQLFLDGDRDVARRRELARDLAERAQSHPDTAERVRLAARAIALDPECVDAAELLVRLVVDPPKVMPRVLAEELRGEEDRHTSERSRRAFVAFLGFFAATPVLAMIQVTNWPMFAAVHFAVLAMTLLSFRTARGAVPPYWVYAGVQLIGVVMFSRIASPFVLAPVLTCAMLLSLTAHPWFNERKWAVTTWTLAAAGLPFALEAVGVFGVTWFETPEGVVTRSDTLGVAPHAGWILLGSNALLLVLVSWFMLGIAHDRRTAQRELYVQRWHLRQLLPASRS